MFCFLQVHYRLQQNRANLLVAVPNTNEQLLLVTEGQVSCLSTSVNTRKNLVNHGIRIIIEFIIAIIIDYHNSRES